jgi:hypothetical protein
MRKDLDYNGLTYFSNKLKAYITKKLKEVSNTISSLATKVDSDKQELEDKIDTTKTDLSTAVQSVDNKVTNVDNKVDTKYQELANKVNAVDYRPTGDTIKINNVDQLIFENITAGQTIVIPHDEDNSDFLIECFARTELTTPLAHKVLNINTANTGLLEYDPRYVEITDAGAKPKSSITLGLTKDQTYNNYSVYISDILPIELVDSISGLNDYSVQ